MNIGGYLQSRQLAGKELERERLVKWYINIPGIPQKEKKVLEKSLSYNVWTSFLFLMISMFVGLIVFGIVFAYIDPFEKITGISLIGKSQCVAVVEEDGVARFKSRNTSAHETLSLEQLGLNNYDLSVGDKINIYWELNEENSSGEKYSILYAMPQNEATKIENTYNLIMIGVMFAIVLISVFLFFSNRRKYTGWYTEFYMRIEKFCNIYHVYEQFQGFSTIEAFMAYGDRNIYSLANEFEKIQINSDDKKERRKKIIKALFIAIVVWIIIIIGCCISTEVAMRKESKSSNIRLEKMLEQFRKAEMGSLEPLGDTSDYYNTCDMINLAKEAFPGEEVFYDIIVNEDKMYVVITTLEKKNVYFHMYVPVNGEVGGDDTIYKLEIAMNSNTMLPEDILKSAKGSW